MAKLYAHVLKGFKQNESTYFSGVNDQLIRLLVVHDSQLEILNYELLICYE